MDENTVRECKLTTSCRWKLQRRFSSKIESARCENADLNYAPTETSAEVFFCGKWNRLNKCILACKIIHGQHIKAKHRAVKSANHASAGDLIKRLLMHKKCITFRMELQTTSVQLWCRCKTIHYSNGIWEFFSYAQRFCFYTGLGGRTYILQVCIIMIMHEQVE